MYLPMVGVLFFLSESDWIKKFSFDKIQYRVAAPVILLFFFILAFRHEKAFSDTKSFLDNAVNMSPSSSLAHRNLGIYYQDMADKPENKERRAEILSSALEEYKRSLALNEHEKDLHNNMGVIYDQFGKKDSAEKEYLTEIKLNPVNGQSFHNLGVICAGRNENDRAENYFKKAMELTPNNGTLQQLALLYKKMGREKDFQQAAMMLQSKQPVGSKQLAVANQQPMQNIQADPVTIAQQLMQNGKSAEAENVFKNILAKDSANTKALFNLGLLYYTERRLPDAEAPWKKAQ